MSTSKHQAEQLELLKVKRPQFKPAVQVFRPDLWEIEPIQVNPRHRWQWEWEKLTAYNPEVGF